MNQEINFDRNGNGLQYLSEGWGNSENWVVWSISKRAALKLPLSESLNLSFKPNPSKLILEIQPFISSKHEYQKY